MSPIQTIQDAISALPLDAAGAIIEPHLRKIGNGGTHDVYILDEGELLPKFTFKLCKSTFNKTPEERSAYIQEKKKQYYLLHKSFPQAPIPIFLERAVKTTKHTKTGVIQVVPFEYGFFAPSKLGIQTLEFNWDELDRLKHSETYQTMNDAIFLNAHPLNIKELAQANLKLAPLLKLIHKDTELKQNITLFCKQLKHHHLNSKDYLDLSGLNNVFIYKNNDGKWKTRVGSVLKSANRALLKRALDALELNWEWVATGPDVIKFKYLLREVYECLRVVRTLGCITGVPDVYKDDQIDRLIQQKDQIESLFFNKEKSEHLLNLYNKTQTAPVAQIQGILSSTKLNPIDDITYFHSLLNHTSEPGKKLHIAHFIHNKLPLSGPEKVYGKWCCFRAILAKAMMQIEAPAAKKLAIACLSDTLWDPKAPRESIKEDIARLK